MIRGRAFEPHGRVSVRVAVGGRVSLTARDFQPSAPGDTRHVYLLPRLDARWPAEAPAYRPLTALRAARRRSQSRVVAAIRRVMLVRGQPVSRHFDGRAARFGQSAPTLSILLSGSDRQTNQDGKERS
jgi:hypothetical protein